MEKPRDQVDNINRYNHDGQIMLCSAIILFLVILVILCFHGYVRRILNRRRHAHRHIHSLLDNVAPARGLDPSILKALPVFVYSFETHESTLECAVCLSEFQDGEKGRLLPRCKHAFHICCIDVWFRTRSNCPLCRAPVQYDSVSEIFSETVVPVTETASLPSELQRKKEDERCPSASSSPSMASLSLVQCPRISSDLVGIIVEVPTFAGEQITGIGSSIRIRSKSLGDPAPSP